MRTMFVVMLVVLVAWSVWAVTLVPPPDPLGRTHLLWLTDDNPVRREQMEAFNAEHRDVVVSVDPSAMSIAKAVVQCIGGSGPDLIDTYFRDQLVMHVRAGTLLPLNGIAERMGFGLDRTWATVIDQCSVQVWNDEAQQYERIQYSFPCNVDAPVMFYNKRLFREAGVPVPPDDWTWDEFADTAAKLTKRRADGRGYERFGVFLYDFRGVFELVWQAGGAVYDDTLTYCTLDSPAALDAVRFFYELIHVRHGMFSPAQQETMAGQGGYGARFAQWFTNEQVAMIRAGRYAMIAIRQQPSLRGEIGVCHVPSRYPDRKVVYLQARSCGVNRLSPHRDAALKFLQYLASPAYNDIVVRTADAMPPVPAYAQSDAFLHDPAHPTEDFNRFFVEAIKRGRSAERCPFIEPNVVSRIVERHLDLMHEQIKSPEDAFRDATAEINARIKHNLVRFAAMREEYQRRTGHRFDANNFPPR